MCLLAVLSRVRDDLPLVVAANRDEWLARPARAMDVLQSSKPRVLGGRDLVAGGTWLAVNEHGLVAGLTNRPSPTGPDRARRSRGELPLSLAQHRDAKSAVAELAQRVRPGEYNECWLLVGDRASLWCVDLGADRVAVEELAPGIWVLENRPLRPPSPKASAVRSAIAPIVGSPVEELPELLRARLSSHDIPDAARARPDAWRPLETEAACVHAGPYGTRSSEIVLVARDATPPAIWFSDGTPCTHGLEAAAARWHD